MKHLLPIFLGLSFMSQAQEPVLFRDFVSGTNGSSVNFQGHHLVKVNGHIVFGAKTDEHPFDEYLYSINGQPGGTVKLPTDNWFFDRGEMLVVNDLLYVTDGLKLYSTDGTVAGTQELVNIPAPLSAPQDLMEYNGKIYFHDVNGILGVYDPGTNQCNAISDTVTYISEITGSPAGLFVNGRSAAYGAELFKLNSAGTALEIVTDIVPGTQGSGPAALRAAGNNLFFCARTSGSSTVTCWLSDGTSAGTQVINNTWEPYNDNSAEEIRREQFISYGSKAYFNTEDGLGHLQVFESNGTAAGTVMTANLPAAPAEWMLGSRNYIYFYYNQFYGGWWQYDPAGNTAVDVPDTVAIPDAQAANLFGYIGGNTIGDSLFHIGYKAGIGFEPFFFNGNTSTHLKPLGDINTGVAESGYNRCNFVELNGAVYFSVQDSAHGIELWCINCTPDTVPDTTVSVPGLAQASGVHLFPNPVSDILTIEFPAASGTFQVFDMYGRTVLSSAIHSRRMQVPMSTLSSGVYIIRTAQPGYTDVQSLVKK